MHQYIIIFHILKDDIIDLTKSPVKNSYGNAQSVSNAF